MATRYWVGGSGNLDGSTTTHISASSGGVGGASYPGSGDTLVLDGNSGSGAVVTLTAPATFGSVTLGTTVPLSLFTGTLLLNASLDVTTVSGGTGIITLTTGTLNTNGQPVTAVALSSSGTGTRALTLGASTITLSSNTQPWQFTTTTGLTFNPGTSTISLTGAPAAVGTGGLTYYDMTIKTGGGNTTINSQPTFHNLTVNGGTSSTGSLSIGNLTVNNLLTLAGNSPVNKLLINSTNTGTQRTLTAAVVALSNIAVQDIKAAGAAVPFPGTGVGDALGNSGWTFDDPLTLYRVGAGGNWSASQWSLTSGGTPDQRFPLAQDTVVIDSGATGTITSDVTRLGRNVDFTGFAGTFASGPNSEVYGNLTLSSDPAFAVTGTGSITLAGRGQHLLITNGKTLPTQLKVDGPGGGYTLDGALTTTNLMQLTNGTFDTGDHPVTITSFTSTAGTNKRTLLMRSSVWTLTGTGTVWNITTNTALVLTPGSSTILIADTSAAAKTFVGNGRTYHDLTFAGGTGTLTMGGSVFATVTWPAGSTIILNADSSTTVGDLHAVGAPGSLITITSSVTDTPAALTKTGGTVVADYLSLRDSIATGTAQWYAGSHSVNVANNTGWQFADPSAGTNRFLPFFAGRL